MADREQRKAFWTTLPGLLTAVATLITSIAGLLALFIKAGAAQRPPQVVAPGTPPALVQSDNPAQDAKSCQRIAGQWWWSTGGMVTIGADGSLQWRAHATDAQPLVVGRWVCTDSQQRQYFFSWSHAYTDTFTLSEDGRRLSGVNQQTQTKLFGNRQE